jgi:hypothetical protein
MGFFFFFHHEKESPNTPVNVQETADTHFFSLGDRGGYASTYKNKEVVSNATWQ